MTATTRPQGGSVSEPTLYVAFELSLKQWKLAMTSGFGVEPWVRTVAAGDLGAVRRIMAEARVRFGLGARMQVVSCYEAGRDGFWIHRALIGLGVQNRVVDSASIEVSRRARRAKTDRLDALKLVRMLVRVCAGEAGVWREVRVPSAEAEAARHVSRERAALVQDHTRLINQMRGWLATWGAPLPRARAGTWWTQVRTWADAPLPRELQERLARAAERLALLETQIATLDRTQTAAIAAAAPTSAVKRLAQVRGVGVSGASVLVAEGLIWREFRNRREIGGFLGFAPTPFQSGEVTHDHGISRAGNPRLQAISVQLAWNWVRWQPESALTRWFHAFATTQRLRRVGIVALARKLLIALWRYSTTGVVPTGAVLKAT